MDFLHNNIVFSVSLKNLTSLSKRTPLHKTCKSNIFYRYDTSLYCEITKTKLKTFMLGEGVDFLLDLCYL